MLQQSDEVVLHLPLAPDAELRAVDALDRMMARHQVEDRAAGQARFALVEACLNAIEYSEAADESPTMDVRLVMRGGELRMSVGNPGSFQLELFPQKPSQPRRGHGLKIIHAFMDRVRYLSDARGTRVEMSKRVGSGS
jgi:anti-sigma regulatory factor (Ser/Thr protein kinase)